MPRPQPLAPSLPGIVTRTRDMRALGPFGVVAIGLLGTFLALLESWRRWPLAPFPLVYAGLAIAVPLWFRVGPSGRPLPEIRRNLRELAGPAVLALAFVGAFVAVYAAILVSLSKAHDPTWNLLVTYHDLGKLFVARYGRPEVVALSYVVLGLWPMFGEELFYRGLLLRGLLEHASPAAAAIVSSAFFGLRHAAQLAYGLPSYPWAASVAYFVWAFGLGLVWCWIYVRTRSLWACIASHSLNVVLAPVAIAFLLR